jgi:hypothetical protein
MVFLILFTHSHLNKGMEKPGSVGTYAQACTNTFWGGIASEHPDSTPIKKLSPAAKADALISRLMVMLHAPVHLKETELPFMVILYKLVDDITLNNTGFEADIYTDVVQPIGSEQSDPVTSKE